MDYEKKYNEALNRAREEYKTHESFNGFRVMLLNIFPELEESEDEKIRNELITHCRNIRGVTLEKAERIVKWLAWLEKQGEQKQDPCEHCKDKCLNCHNFPCIDKRTFEQGKTVIEAITEETVDNANKVEPRFKDGDWIVYKDAVWKVCNISLQNYYELLKTNNEVSTRLIEDVDENAHLWTIADAVDGDVLAAHECIVVFKKIDGLNIRCHCTYHLGFNPNFHIYTLHNKAAFHPATKEERDTLMKAISDAGYVWDSESNELFCWK